MDEEPASNARKPHVVVLGGGLAGMAAACDLLDDGYAVSLVEKRPYLGGRTFSFSFPLGGQRTDSGTGEHDSGMPEVERGVAASDAGPEGPGEWQVDNGQHIFLGCCTRYIEFLRKLGTLESTYLQDSLRVRVVSPGRNGHREKSGVLSSSALPAPFHMLPSFLRYPHLGLKDKVLAAYALTRIIFTNRHSPQLAETSFYDWLKGYGQTDRIIDNFWGLIIVPTLNDHPRDVSAAMGLMVYQEGVLKSRGGASVGYSRVGLSSLMGDAAGDYILRRGGRLLLGKRVSKLLLAGTDSAKAKEGTQAQKIEGVELDGRETITGDSYVSALAFHDLARVLPPPMADDPFFRGTRELSTSPILNVHIWYDRPVMAPSSPPFLTFLDSPLQWVFDKGAILGTSETADAQGRYICISVSGAWEYANQSKEEIQEIFLGAMAEAFPRAAEARVERMLMVKSLATFRCSAGTERLRPTTGTPVENFFLAGDWTDTGWPSTMEGAVISGVKAAEAIAARYGDG